MNISELMTTDVITLNEDDTLDKAHSSMGWAGIRHLPVIRKGRLIGLVTHRDLLKVMFSALAEVDEKGQDALLRAVDVSSIMAREVRTVDEGCDVVRAARILLDSKIGCLPVVTDGDHLVGIVTEADFVELAIQVLDAEYQRSDEEEEAELSGEREPFNRQDDEDW